MDFAVPLSSSNSHTYTPVRRRESTINTRLLNADQEQEWTAARCHRLLRALTSRVAILKKDLSRFQSTGKETVGNGKAAAHRDSKAVDAEWTKQKKRIRQTYSGRGGRGGDGAPASKKGRKSLLPGEVTVPTPILARARGEYPIPQAPLWTTLEEPPADIVRGNKRPRTRHAATDGGPFQPSGSLRDLRQKVTAAKFTTYEGIYNGLEALLRATTNDGSEERTKSKGPRSLLSMALRAVPQYITQQENLLQAYIEETGSKMALYQRDISTEIYDELESFGSSRHGWKRLKVIVRSHGVQVVCDAIHLGVFDDAFCGVLIALCINTFAVEEAQSILSALLSSRQYASPKTLYDTIDRPLLMLSSFTDFTSRTSFQFRELSNLLANGLLPVEWLATKELSPVWTRAIQHLTPGMIDEDAVTFLDNSLSLLSSTGTDLSTLSSNAVTEAVKNTFSSLLTTLVSIVRLSWQEQEKEDVKNPGRNGYSHVMALLKGCLVQSGISDMQTLLLLANLSVQEETRNIAGLDESLISLLLVQLQQEGTSSGHSSAYSQSVSFICQVARCCGRGSASPGFEHLERIHQALEMLASDKKGNSLIHGLIVDSAFAFAQKVPDRKHIDYASSMDTRFCARRLDVDTSLQGSSEEDDNDVSGFRWEEGIGEWVTATPALVTKTKVMAPKAFADDSECDTPYRPAPKARRLENQPAPSLPAASSPFSSPNFDDSVRVQSLVGSPSGSGLDISDSSGEEDSILEDAGLIESDDELNSNTSQDLECRSEDSKMEVSFAEDSLLSHGSSTSLASLASLGRPLIDRVPRLKGRLLRNNDWEVFEDSFVSSASSTLSIDSMESTGYREFVDRAPRLGRRALRSSQAWQLFDDSDDELSILSVSSNVSGSGEALKDVTSRGTSNARRPRQVKSAKPSKTRSMKTRPLSDSEDELCI
ncbi:hypothetical protein VTL71DRAFT_8355 [Oculimacula yallundae]|uniref:Wings apart-like protein C-terminal domain-containing protein n=1 Tax=Oculimacula yallundae TaxID=86028 RepID=A0ABR4CXI9_9HELO